MQRRDASLKFRFDATAIKYRRCRSSMCAILSLYAIKAIDLQINQSERKFHWRLVGALMATPGLAELGMLPKQQSLSVKLPLTDWKVWPW